MTRTKLYHSTFTLVLMATACGQEDDFAVGGGWDRNPASEDDDQDRPYDDENASDEDEQPPQDDVGPLLRGGTVYTLNSNGDKVLSPGEWTTPGPEFDHKETCSQGITLSSRACLMEEGENGELGGLEMCGNFETTLECDDEHLLSQGNTECVGGEYCEILVPALGEPGRCGWRITELVATNADTGEVLERIDSEFIEALGFELLPVEPN